MYYIFKDMKAFVNSYKVQLLTGKKNYKNELIDYISQNMDKPYSKESMCLLMIIKRRVLNT